MTEPREPEQIRQDCARKLNEVKVSDQFTAILACLLDQEWTSPRIEELFLSPDHCLVARVAGQMSHKTFLGAEVDLIRNIHGVAKVAELDGDELGYLLGQTAKIKRRSPAPRPPKTGTPSSNGQVVRLTEVSTPAAPISIGKLVVNRNRAPRPQRQAHPVQMAKMAV